MEGFRLNEAGTILENLENCYRNAATSCPSMMYGMVGSSAAMRAVYEFIGRVAPTEATVLMQGESGTGKELVAAALHRYSPRAEGPFVAINCAALPENLMESELFGHARGAFSGAVADKKGRIELADRGTLFLDEIGELPLLLQAKLLRALQERTFERLGGIRPVKVDVRVIAATNVNLQTAMQEGTFRPDLFYRLDVVSLHLPPLRERREDILPLAEWFAARCTRRGRRLAGIALEAQNALLSYHWPGNVRELQNAIERAAVLGTCDLIQKEDLPRTIAGNECGGSRAHYRSAVRHFKQQLILSAVCRAEGSFTEAAKILDVHPNYLHRLIKILELRDRLRHHSPQDRVLSGSAR